MRTATETDNSILKIVMLSHHFHFHYLKVRGQCIVSVHKIAQPMTFEETINSCHYVQLILTLYFNSLTQ